MDLPVGSIVDEGLKTSKVDIEKYLNALVSKSFSGYLIVSIEGFSGLEEGFILLKKGLVAAAFFEYNKFSVEIYGDSAFLQFLNACKAPFGIIDIVALTAQQVDLITAFHDKLLVSEKMASSAKNLNKLIPLKYDSKFAQSVLEQVLKSEESKYDVMRKLGLAELKN